jgi:hypothetical protein
VSQGARQMSHRRVGPRTARRTSRRCCAPRRSYPPLCFDRQEAVEKSSDGSQWGTPWRTCANPIRPRCRRPPSWGPAPSRFPLSTSAGTTSAASSTPAAWAWSTRPSRSSPAASSPQGHASRCGLGRGPAAI